MQLLGVLLDLLGLVEGFGELSEIGKSETGHGTAEGTGTLIGRLEAQAFHFWMQRNAFGLHHFALHQADQGADVVR